MFLTGELTFAFEKTIVVIPKSIRKKKVIEMLIVCIRSPKIQRGNFCVLTRCCIRKKKQFLALEIEKAIRKNKFCVLKTFGC